MEFTNLSKSTKRTSKNHSGSAEEKPIQQTVPNFNNFPNLKSQSSKTVKKKLISQTIPEKKTNNKASLKNSGKVKNTKA